jgi:hypothetical protein
MRATIALGALLFSGCATIPLNAPPFSVAAAAPAGFSNVYLYRQGAYPTMRSPVITLDGKRVLSPPEGSYTVLPMSVGQHDVVIDWGWDTGWPDLDFKLDVEEGQTSYLKLSGSFETSGSQYTAGSMVHTMPEALAVAEMTRCCRYIRPEQ